MLPMPAFAETQYELFELDAEVADAHVASANNEDQLPPIEWFQTPDLSGPTPLTIKDGRLFGHIALWNECHIGIQGTCTTAPRSSSEYAYFTRGSVLTWCEKCGREEEVAVGPITAQTGHASTALNKAATIAHYDNSGTRVADVAAGEDKHGIWVSGRIAPTATKEQVEALMALGVSGDWRRQNGSLELVAVLSVPVPGYPIQRKTLAHVAAGNVQTALITAPFGANAFSRSQLRQELDAVKKVTIDLMKDRVNAN